MDNTKLYFCNPNDFNLNNSGIDKQKYNFVRDCLNHGKVGVLKEGALYRLIGCASDCETIERISAVNSSKLNRTITIFISDIKQVKNFGVTITNELILGIKTYWPGEYSIILPTSKTEDYLKICSCGGICFHMSDCFEILSLIDEVGPIVTRLANVSDIKELEDEINIDFYHEIPSGKKDKNKIIKFIDGSVVKLVNS